MKQLNYQILLEKNLNFLKQYLDKKVQFLILHFYLNKSQIKSKDYLKLTNKMLIILNLFSAIFI